MLKRLKNVLCCLLVFMLISSFIGCTKGDEQASKKGKEETIVDSNKEKEGKGEEKKEDESADPYAPIEGKKYKISWTGGITHPLKEESDLIEYWNEKFNVELDIWELESGKYNELLNLKFSSGDIPDKIFVRGFDNFIKYQEQDVLLEIPEETLKTHAPDMYTKFQDEMPELFEYGKIDNKLYGIPGLANNNIFRTPLVMRADWLENVGVNKAPETLEEFEDVMYKFVREDPNKSGKDDTYGMSNSVFNAIYGAFGYIPTYWTEKDGELVYGAVQPEMKEALDLLSKWYKDGIIDPEFITGENQGGYWAISHAFVNGRIGVSAHGSYYHWKPASWEGDEEVGTYPEFKKIYPEGADLFLFIQPPIGPEGKRGIAQGNLVSGTLDSFGKHLSDEPDKVGKILEILNFTSASSEENLLTAVYGIKGKHWDFADDGGIKRLVEDLPAEIGGNTLMLSAVPSSIYFALYPGRQEFAKEKGLDQNGIQNALIYPLPSAGKYLAELDKLREETYVSIITGDKTIDYFDDFVEQWRKMGGEELEKEANDWYSSHK